MVLAIETDAGMKIPGLAKSIAEAKSRESGRVHTPEQILFKAARSSLHLSQPKFAKWIDTPAGTLQDWEQGRFQVPGAVKRLLQIVVAHPEVVLKNRKQPHH